MIYLSPYNPQWPNLFIVEKEMLLSSLGTKIRDIQHIGSTAIPNIYAKPTIDIMIGVDSLNEIDSATILMLEKVGYEYIKKYEEMMPFRRYFQKNNKEGIRTHQIHLVEISNPFWEKHLLFRDYLTAHSEEAKQYQKLKLELAEKFSDTNQYANAKTDYCNEIYLKALRWRL